MLRWFVLLCILFLSSVYGYNEESITLSPYSYVYYACQYGETPFLCDTLHIALKSYFRNIVVDKDPEQLNIKEKYDLCVIVADGSEIYGISFDKKHLITDLTPLKNCAITFMIVCDAYKYKYLFKNCSNCVYIAPEGEVYNVPSAILLVWWVEYLRQGYSGIQAFKHAKEQVLSMEDFFKEVYEMSYYDVYDSIEKYKYYGTEHVEYDYEPSRKKLIKSSLTDSRVIAYTTQVFGTSQILIPLYKPVWVLPAVKVVTYEGKKYLYPMNLYEYKKYIGESTYQDMIRYTQEYILRIHTRGEKIASEAVEKSLEKSRRLLIIGLCALLGFVVILLIAKKRKR